MDDKKNILIQKVPDEKYGNLIKECLIVKNYHYGKIMRMFDSINS